MMATISEDQRYAELLTHVDFPDWWVFVVGATHVIEQHTGQSLPVTTVGLIEAKRQGVDFTELKWAALLWEIGSWADFIERLERAVAKV
jgi:hypothetical protein